MTEFMTTLTPLFPELALCAGALFLVLLGSIVGEKSSDMVHGIAIALLIVVGIFIVISPAEKQQLFNGAYIIDTYGRFMKMLVISGSATAIVLSIGYFRSLKESRFEYPLLIVLSTIGMMMMISAGDLIALYMGLEMMSLSLYVLAAIERDSLRSTEAGLKYFVLGALSSGMLLYGISLIYGFSGSVNFASIARSASSEHAGIGLIFGLVFLLAGLCFKISAVPFHMWTPDVYEGAPTPVTTFFAGAPKIAAFAVLIRVLITAFPADAVQWKQIIIFVSIASMALGAFAAIGQTNIKRLIAYSSIGHMGFALVGLAAATPGGVEGVLVYLAIYLLMTVGTFACLLAMQQNGQGIENISEFAGLSKTRPGLALVLATMMFSLAGIPPLAGFIAKFYVFLAAIQANLYALAVIGVLSSAVGAYYYLRVVKVMYFDEPAARPDQANFEVRSIYALSGLAVILLLFMAQPLLNMAATAANSLF